MTHAAGVNRDGVVVGNDQRNDRAFVYVHRSRVLSELPGHTVAGDINDHGQIVASSLIPDNGFVALVFYLSGGETILASFFSDGCAISHSGLFAAGDAGDAYSFPQAVRWRVPDDSEAFPVKLVISDSQGLFKPFNHPDGRAQGVNDDGAMVGSSDTPTFDSHGHEAGIATRAFLWQNGVPIDLGTLPGGTSSSANGINDRGEIVGRSDTANGVSHAFLLRRDKMLDLGTLSHDPTLSSVANRINDGGDIVGSSEVRLAADNSIVQRAFVYNHGRLRNLTQLIERESPLFGRVTLTSANAISCNGQIAADGFDNATLESHAYLLIPQDHARPSGGHGEDARPTGDGCIDGLRPVR